MAHIDPVIIHLTINGETIATTPEHPFYERETAPWLAVGETEGRWTRAGELIAGDQIQQADGTTGVVQTIVFEATPQVMYNLTVAEAHTFFVGDGNWLVHNAKCYRVEGTPNLRLDIDGAGNVSMISGKDGMLHLSFGGPGHAEYFLQKKIKANLPGAHVKEFEVEDEFLDTLRRDAVLQDEAPDFPGRPQIDDPGVIRRYNLNAEAYGIPSTYFQMLVDAILPETGKIWR